MLTHEFNSDTYQTSVERVLSMAKDPIEISAGLTFRGYEIKRLRREEAIARFEIGIIMNKREDSLSRRTHMNQIGLHSYELMQCEKMAAYFDNSLPKFLKAFDENGNTWTTLYKKLINRPKKLGSTWKQRLEKLNGIVKGVMEHGTPEDREDLIEVTGMLKSFLDRHFAHGVDAVKLGMQYNSCACCGDLGQGIYEIRQFVKDGSTYQYPICNRCLEANNEPKPELLLKLYWGEFNTMQNYLDDMNGEI